MTHVTMLLSNPYKPDPRVERAASALIQAGYQVRLICWDRSSAYLPSENQAGLQIDRVQHVRSSYGMGWRQLFYLPRFWSAARQVAAQQPIVAVHCHDLDTLVAGYMLKRRLGCRLVYDAHEQYPALMSLYLPGFLVKLLTWLEKWLLKHVDLTITASNLLMKEYQQSGIAPVINIANVARLEEFQIEPAKIKAFRASLDIRENDFLISYIGGFSRNRLILPLIEAAADLPDLCVCIWGDGHQRPEIDAAAGRTTNVRYLGWLADAQVPLAVLASDLIYYCLKADYPGAIYNAPNTLSNCLAAGRPILANDVGDLGHIVRSEKCGQILDTVTPESIRQAIMSMRNPQIYQIYAHSARTAALSKYNWALVARQLVSAYQQLISPP